MPLKAVLFDTLSQFGVFRGIYEALKIIFKHTVDDQPLALIYRLSADYIQELSFEQHIPYNLIKKDKSIKGSMQSKRERAALDDEYRTELLKQVVQL